MNFDVVSPKKMVFTPIDPMKKQNMGDFLTIRSADCYISESLYTKMNYPDYVQFAISSDEKTFALKATNEFDTCGLKAKQFRKELAGRVSSFRLISKRIESVHSVIDFSKSNLLMRRCYVNGDYFCFDFKDSEIVDIRRKKKS